MPAKVYSIVYAILICIVVIVAAGAGYIYVQSLAKARSAEEASGRAMAKIVGDRVNSDDLTGALSLYDVLTSSATATPKTVAPVVLAGSDISHHLSGEVDDVLASVRELKKLVLNSELRPFIRAEAALLTGYKFRNSGYNLSVFEEIFSGEPFGHLYLERNYINSLERLYLYSYNIWPLSHSAIAIANQHILDLYRSEQLGYGNDKTRANKIKNAEEYLSRALDLENSQYEQPSEARSKESYLSDKVVAIGSLAYFKGAPYDDQYRKTYDDSHEFLRESKNSSSDRILALSHIWYAQHLVDVDGDTAAAKKELENAVALVKSDPYVASNPVVLRIRDSKTRKSPFEIPKMSELIKISAEFKALYDSIK